MHILLHDYGGYAFIASLARALAERGHIVDHVYAAHNPTPKGRLVRSSHDSAGLTFHPLTTGRRLRKWNLPERWIQERAYGKLLARKAEELHPEIVLSANTPLDAQESLLQASVGLGVPFVYWVQDLIGSAMKSILSERLGVIGKVTGDWYIKRDIRLQSRSSGIIVISEAFRQIIQRHLPGRLPIAVFPNWAPIEEIPFLPKENAWARRHSLDGTFVFLYSGSLGLKNDVKPLEALFRRFRHERARIVIVSTGRTADRLSGLAESEGIENVEVLPLQPMEDYPQALAAADVLVAVLDDKASTFSVPSKVLSYLCAGRALLLSSPEESPAAQIVEQAQAGLIRDPSDTAGFIRDAEFLFGEADARRAFGANARSFAEKQFDMGAVNDQFEAFLGARLK